MCETKYKMEQGERQGLIVQYLMCNRNTWTHIRILAEKYHYCEKTIHRDITRLEINFPTLFKFESKTGRAGGVKITLLYEKGMLDFEMIGRCIN